jgi:septal ring factor EnvC (AmiA/AmiB activator)
MWKQIYEYTKDFLLLSRETQENKSDIKEQKTEIKEIRSELKKLQSDFGNLLLVVQKLSFEIQKIDEREQGERREMTLKLENEMLKFERRLPRAKDE